MIKLTVVTVSFQRGRLIFDFFMVFMVFEFEALFLWCFIEVWLFTSIARMTLSIARLFTRILRFGWTLIHLFGWTAHLETILWMITLMGFWGQMHEIVLKKTSTDLEFPEWKYLNVLLRSPLEYGCYPFDYPKTRLNFLRINITQWFKWS